MLKLTTSSWTGSWVKIKGTKVVCLILDLNNDHLWWKGGVG